MCIRVTLVGHVLKLPPEHSVRVVINLETDPGWPLYYYYYPQKQFVLFNYIPLHYIVLEHCNKYNPITPPTTFPA